MVGSTGNPALMTLMVALVRGINVGGHSKVTMTRLREIATSCGLDNVKSYIQSGNLVFSDTVRTPLRIADSLADGLVDSVGIAATVMVRTKPELEQILRSNPFIDQDPTGAHLHVMFLHGPASELAELPVMTEEGGEGNA